MSTVLAHRRLAARLLPAALLSALALAAASPSFAEVSATAAADGTYSVLAPTTRSRAEVLKSISSWHVSTLSESPNPSVATWSADNGLLSEQESGDGSSSRIKFNDLDLSSLRASLSGQWQIHAASISGHGSGFTGHLSASGENSQAVALQALQDIYDLAYAANLLSAAQVHCEFGHLDQYLAQRSHENTNLWSDIRHAPNGRTAEADILYQVADLVQGPTVRGGQTISFAAQSLANEPVNVDFAVDLVSNTGSKVHYELTQAVASASDPLLLGANATLTREPFAPGQCITQVSVSSVVVKPLPVAARRAPMDPHRASSKTAVVAEAAAPAARTAAPEDAQPPIGKKLPTLLPLATTPTLDEACPYPKGARDRGDTGVVMLLVHVGPQGAALDTALEQSSGSDLLDQTTLACVKAAGRFPVHRTGAKPASYWGRMKFNWSFGG